MPSGTPAPGFRDSTSGALDGIGKEGSVWSSAVNGTNGMYLNFHSQYLIPSSAAYRGDSFQLRCLSE